MSERKRQRRGEEPEHQEWEAMGLTEERWQLTKAEESRKQRSWFIDVDFLEKASRMALRVEEGRASMNTVYIEGDGEADGRKSFIRTSSLHRHDSHILQNYPLILKACIVVPFLFIQQSTSRHCGANEVHHLRKTYYVQDLISHTEWGSHLFFS